MSFLDTTAFSVLRDVLFATSDSPLSLVVILAMSLARALRYGMSKKSTRPVSREYSAPTTRKTP